MGGQEPDGGGAGLWGAAPAAGRKRAVRAAVVRPVWNALSVNAGFRGTLSHFLEESERALVENPH
ncbi:hypothetical protein GCM10009712_00980 [Pseudarthrobacter sulfonivorans]